MQHIKHTCAFQIQSHYLSHIHCNLCSSPVGMYTDKQYLCSTTRIATDEVEYLFALVQLSVWLVYRTEFRFWRENRRIFRLSSKKYVYSPYDCDFHMILYCNIINIQHYRV